MSNLVLRMKPLMFRCGCPAGYNGERDGAAGWWYWHGDNPEARRWFPSHLVQPDGRVAGLKEWFAEIHAYEQAMGVFNDAAYIAYGES